MTNGEVTLLVVALVCVLLSALSTSQIPALVFGIGSVALCVAEAVNHRRRTGRWRR